MKKKTEPFSISKQEKNFQRIIDSEKVEKTFTRGNVREVTADQLSESAQLAFKLRSKIEGHELYQTDNPSEIVITLRTPIENNLYINSIKDIWFLDTIVLDAGHGGKDGGTQGEKGTKEKSITLDITNLGTHKEIIIMRLNMVDLLQRQKDCQVHIINTPLLTIKWKNLITILKKIQSTE